MVLLLYHGALLYELDPSVFCVGQAFAIVLVIAKFAVKRCWSLADT